MNKHDEKKQWKKEYSTHTVEDAESLEQLQSKIESAINALQNKNNGFSLVSVSIATAPADIKVYPSSPDDHLLAAVMLWTIGRDTVSVNLIQHSFNIGWHKATEMVKRLENMSLVRQPIGKLPRYVAQISFEDIPADMHEFLRRNGITDEDIMSTISNRYGETGEPTPGQPCWMSHPERENPSKWVALITYSYSARV